MTYNQDEKLDYNELMTDLTQQGVGILNDILSKKYSVSDELYDFILRICASGPETKDYLSSMDIEVLKKEQI